jgi:predicted nuclease of predicted toxin-antitoxin system
LKFLADENIPPLIVERLRDGNLDVEAIWETSPGASDTDILSRADIGDLILITFDSDFGDLIFHQAFPCPAAIIYTRLNRTAQRHIADRIIAVVEAGIPMGHMTVITKNGERQKPLPSGAKND